MAKSKKTPTQCRALPNQESTPVRRSMRISARLEKNMEQSAIDASKSQQEKSKNATPVSLKRSVRISNDRRGKSIVKKEPGLSVEAVTKCRTTPSDTSVASMKSAREESKRTKRQCTEQLRKLTSADLKGAKQPKKPTIGKRKALKNDEVPFEEPLRPKTRGQRQQFKIPVIKIQKTTLFPTIISDRAGASQSTDETFKCPASRRIRKLEISIRRPSISIGSLQPVIRERTTPIKELCSDVHLAKKSLHLSEVPNSLPCRQREVKEIHQLIQNTILDSSGGCIYVCGVPGTGKTATIAEVMRTLRLQSEKKTLPQFELIHINGMRLTEPQQAYVQIYQHLTGAKVRWDEAVPLLDRFFKNPFQRKPTVLVADEFDSLRSSGQRVIYKLLDWSMKESARFLVVAIGNIVNTEGMEGGIRSRLGATRFTFLPYTQTQLRTIVQARLAGLNIIESDAVELAARKVASISGDCRRFLDICRRATEIGEKDCVVGKKIVVTMSHVAKAFDEMISNPKMVGLRGCSKYEKLFLQAVVAEIARTGTDQTVLFQVYRQFETICALNGVIVPEPGIALRISSRLGSARLLICEDSSNSIHQKIMLNVTEDEIRNASKTD